MKHGMCHNEMNEKHQSNTAFEKGHAHSNTLAPLPGKGWWGLFFLKWFSSCRSPKLMQDSVPLFLLLIQERQKAGGGKKIQWRVGEEKGGWDSIGWIGEDFVL